jgi:hypothetical protein
MFLWVGTSVPNYDSLGIGNLTYIGDVRISLNNSD